MKTSGVINNAFVQYQVQRFVYCECRRVNVAIATSLLSFVCDALELCLLHSSLPSLLCTPPSLPAKLPSVSTTLYFLFLQQWQQQCRQPDCPPIHTPTHPSANPLTKGQEGPSLAQCLMGSDSSVFWDYTR